MGTGHTWSHWTTIPTGKAHLASRSSKKDFWKLDVRAFRWIRLVPRRTILQISTHPFPPSLNTRTQRVGTLRVCSMQCVQMESWPCVAPGWRVHRVHGVHCIRGSKKRDCGTSTCDSGKWGSRSMNEGEWSGPASRWAVGGCLERDSRRRRRALLRLPHSSPGR